MIQIKPIIEHRSSCHQCGGQISSKSILWQGIHVGVNTVCDHCNKEYIEDLKVGHATYLPFKIELPEYHLIGGEKARKWLGEPFRKSIQYPSLDREISVSVEIRKETKRSLIINCIDYLYGHALLKLLNVQREYERHSDLSIIVIVQKPLKWMVPKFVSEIWTVNIPFNHARNFYPQLNECIQAELQRFDEVYVSRAYSHPSHFKMELFTGVQGYSSEKDECRRVSFVWREDRFWMDNFILSKAIQKFPKLKKWTLPFLLYQKSKVIRLFRRIKMKYPSLKFTVVGLGETGSFPDWIEDHRVGSFNEKSEKFTCQIYSQSFIVIGIHGSNMLLPSAHAGITVDLMPKDRWGNYAQDVLFQEFNNRLASYKYRFIPIEVKIKTIANIILSQLDGYEHFVTQMNEEEAALVKELA
ncbi:hypothetical protein M3647_03990 [Paenibacillus cellulositrophicus]|uniref:hypothetical protein n=1 Tax=Paenibacillus cellulositrophicus TaxID=562959 RepID=UPI00204049E0|nr:hypothetical protein [Paenibacillus cellulositrophicus]MCM2996625.1 hypothetical protein [Paenibacillus cellulositrophicus]